MGLLHLCLKFSGEKKNFLDNSSYERAYEVFYKNLVAVLYANPSACCSAHFSGTEIEWLKKKNPEFIELTKKLVTRKQLEILGGGYYNPVFPLIFPQDRTGQIEKLSASIRQNFSRRPRGLCICEDSWDASLVMSFNSCSMKYVVLDSSLFPQNAPFGVPIIMADKGKSILIVPSYKDLLPQNQESPKTYFMRLKNVANKITDDEKIAVIPFSEESIPFILKDNWLENFLFELSNDIEKTTSLSTISNALKNIETFTPAYIPESISKDITKWMPNKRAFNANIHDYLQTCPLSYALYNRMIDVSLLVNQCHGDKMRKKAARDALWEAQNGNAYICSSYSAFVNPLEREASYKSLTESEKLVRQCSEFNESLSSYDYNGDGFNEYVCHQEKFNACIQLNAGTIFELDVMKSNENYANNMSRSSYFDGFDDNYFRGIFIDHLFNEEEFKKYCIDEPCKNEKFATKRYKEVSFSPMKHEIQLECANSFLPQNQIEAQNVFLKKNYTITTNGIVVQYILKNESPNALNAKFVVEVNLNENDFLSQNYKPYSVEIINGTNMISVLSDKKSIDIKENGIIEAVSTVQITDTKNMVSFLFEANEDSKLKYSPITFKRQVDKNKETKSVGQTFSLSFIWDVNLESGMEMEKIINLTIFYSKKKRKT